MSQLITITHQPPQFSPVYTDGLFFTIIAADFSFPKFRYVYEVYVDGQVIFQGKCTPNPFGLGIIDVSGILKNYVTNLPLSYFTNVPIYTHQTFPFSRPLEQNVILYSIKFGYEYAIDETSPVQQYNGNGIFQFNPVTSEITVISDLGLPAVDTGPFKTYHATMGVNGRSDQQDFDINPYILSGTPLNVNPTTTGLFLTNSPRTRDIQPTEYYTLGFTNYYLNANGQNELLSQPYYVEYNFYNDVGALIATKQYLNIYSNGGGPLLDCIDVYQSIFTITPKTNTEYNTLYVGCGPENIIDFPADTAQYTVQLFGNFTGTTAPPPTSVPTPTPTPTPIVCTNCKTYSIENNNGFLSAIYSYRDCDTLQLQNNILPPLSAFGFCACEGTFVEETDLLEVTILDSCGPKPCVDCDFVTVFNNNLAITITFDYFDCTFGPTGNWRIGSILPGQSTQFCACLNSFDFGDFTNVNVSSQGVCEVGPLPPTPTPPCTFIATTVQLVNTQPCVNNICTPTVLGSTTVYTDCNTPTPFAFGARVYADSGLSSTFVGTISNGTVVYKVSSAPFVTGGIATFFCVINSPC